MARQRTRTIKYWIERKAVHGETVASTRTLFIAAMKTFSTFCGLRFIDGGSYRRSRVRIRFANNATMKRIGKEPNKGPPLALQFSQGVIYVNSERALDWNIWAMPVFGHELGHANRLKHSSRREDLMNGNLTSKFWSPREIAWWQRKFTPRTFTPPDLVAALAKLPNNSAKRALLKSFRHWEAANINVKI